jgi:hypothetical protein
MLYPELVLHVVDKVPPAASVHCPARSRVVPDGATACYVGDDRLVTVEEGAIVLFAVSDGAPPLRELERRSTYPGRLVATLGDVIVLAGMEAPWVFFRCQADHLLPVGEIRQDNLRVLDHVLVDDRIYLIGRGSGVDEQIVTPRLEEPPPRPEFAGYDHGDAWRTLVGIPHFPEGWHGFRGFQEVLDEVLAGAGIARLSLPGGALATLVLWFRDRSSGLSLLVVPAAAMTGDTRQALNDLDGTHLTDGESASYVQSVLQHLWPFTVGFIDETQEQPTEIAERIDWVVCVRTG